MPDPTARTAYSDISKQNPVPVPVVESAVGIGFLKSLGVEPPPRVRNRIRVVPYHVTIRCELQRIYPESTSEDCVVSAVAEAEGHRLAWRGYHWLETTPPGRRKHTPGESLFITVYDRSALAEVRQIIEPLNLKSSPARLGRDAPGARRSAGLLHCTARR